jgi:hypothetical protein
VASGGMVEGPGARVKKKGGGERGLKEREEDGKK